MKKALLYIAGILIAIAMICFSLTVLADTQIIAPVIIGVSIYLILGFIIKLCRMNDKIKNTVICEQVRKKWTIEKSPLLM